MAEEIEDDGPLEPLLHGVRVLDFGRYIAGPFCAAMLGDLGAEVARIERLAGSEDRYICPVMDSGEGALFLQVNRNKLSVTRVLPTTTCAAGTAACSASACRFGSASSTRPRCWRGWNSPASRPGSCSRRCRLRSIEFFAFVDASFFWR